MTLWPSIRPASLPPAFGPDPDLLLRLSRDLTAPQAQHLAILTERGITANSARLAGALQFHRFHPLTGRVLTGTGGGLEHFISGLFHTAPQEGEGRGVQVSCKDEQSGPYRRVYSKPGFAYQYSRVYLPSDNKGDLHEEKQAGCGDTAFVYVGGWGARGGAVDAGFQHGHYMNRPQDDWAPFFLVQQPGGPSAVTVSDQRQAGGDPWRLAAGQNADLTFWVTQDADLTVLSMSISGITNLDRTQSSLTLRAPIDARFGWEVGGGLNILKRMTTIGQTYGKQNLNTGSFIQGVNWQGSRIGVSEADAQDWRAEHTGGYCTFPEPNTPEGQRSDGQGPKWVVEFRDAGNETDSVRLD